MMQVVKVITTIVLLFYSGVHYGQDGGVSSYMTLSIDIGQQYQHMPVLVDDLGVLMRTPSDLASSFVGGFSIAKHDSRVIQRISAGLAMVQMRVTVPKDQFYSSTSVEELYAYFSYHIGLANRFAGKRLGYVVTGGPLAFFYNEDNRSTFSFGDRGHEGRHGSTVVFSSTNAERSPSIQAGVQLQTALTYPVLKKLDFALWSSATAWIRRTYRTAEMIATVDGRATGRAVVQSYMPAFSWGLRISVDI